MSRFGEMPSNITHELVYQANFGDMPDKSVYLDTLAGAFSPEATIDRREEVKAEIFKYKPEIKAFIEGKAVTTGSPLFAIGTTYSGTSGSIPVMLPTIVDPSLYDKTKRATPLASGLIPRVTNKGLFADYIKRTALPSAMWKAEMGALDAQASTYSRAATAVKFLYAVGEISGPMMVASKVWQNALTLETEAHYRALKEMEEDTIINGYPTTGDVSGGTTDAKAFTGLIQTITTNYTNKSSAVVTLSNIRDAIRVIREAKGEPDLIITDYKTLDDVKGLIQDLMRYPAPTASIAFGIQTIEFEGIPIIPDLFMPTTATSREMLVLSVRKQGNIQMRVLQEAAFEELGKNADSYRFMIKEYLTMIVVYEDWCYRIYNLA